MSSTQRDDGFVHEDERAKRAVQVQLLSAWHRKVGRRRTYLGFTSLPYRALSAAHSAIREQIGEGEIATAEMVAFERHSENVLRIHIALLELAEICKQGSDSSWPSPNRAANADAWQNTYEKLAIRISDERVDVSRPLKPLARVTARRFMLTEYRRQGRTSALDEHQLHRFNLGSELPPEEEVEAARRRAALRASLARALSNGRLSADELAILDGRYVKGWTSGEIAAAAGMTPDNVRQLCARRCGVLRRDLAGQELEQRAA